MREDILVAVHGRPLLSCDASRKSTRSSSSICRSHNARRYLGKLKIPGYSDYLHPYDETHIIGIGKDAVDASEGDVSSRGLDFAWYQGVKMAIFDVSDVEHPKEMFKELIGDRGTDSPVLSDHRAFLFDKEKGLLVLPITLAEVKGPRTSPYQQGEYVFQGAYVYKVDLTSGFTLRGKVTQYDSNEVFEKSGYYFYGDRSISRSLYIGNVLYTLSSTRLQSNDLDTLRRSRLGSTPTSRLLRLRLRCRYSDSDSDVDSGSDSGSDSDAEPPTPAPTPRKASERAKYDRGA